MSVSGGVVGKHSALIFNPWLAEIQTGDNNIYWGPAVYLTPLCMETIVKAHRPE